MQVLSMIESKAPFFWQVFFGIPSVHEKNLPISPSIQDNPRKATLAKQRVIQMGFVGCGWLTASGSR